MTLQEQLLLTNDGVLHLVVIQNGRRLSDERCQIDDVSGYSLLESSEEQRDEEAVGVQHRCEYCFPVE